MLEPFVMLPAPATPDGDEAVAAARDDDAADGALAQPSADDAGDAPEDADAATGEEASADDPASPSALPIDDVPLPATEPAALSALEAQLARRKATLDRFGPVNVLAAQEYEEHKARNQFLITQRDDLRQSIASLEQTIAEINRASSERFRDTFHAVNRTFGETFQKLFRGGEAEMRLLDEDDLLETGIEIVARPPGKRPQNIMLLSGGEKALTAVALLFALFQAKPSPFCILDEVDAPLDDVNVLRFVELLREMSQGTQFLVVTHNKLTMEVADTLYGVTMEEKGVSKLISVEMDRVHPALPAAASA